MRNVHCHLCTQVVFWHQCFHTLTAVILDIVNLLFTVLLSDKILIMGLRETSCLLVTLYFHFYLLVRLRHYKLLG